MSRLSAIRSVSLGRYLSPSARVELWQTGDRYVVAYLPKNGLAWFAGSDDFIRAQSHFSTLVENERKSETRIRVATPEPEVPR